MDEVNSLQKCFQGAILLVNFLEQRLHTETESSSIIYLLRFILFQRVTGREKGTQMGLPSTDSFRRLSAMTRAEPGQSQELESVCGCRRPSGPSSAVFFCLQQEAGLEVEHLVHKQEHIVVASVAIGSLPHYATVLAHILLLFELASCRLRICLTLFKML